MSFIKQLKKVINSGQSRSIVLTGNVYDLFFDGTKYVPLMSYLSSQCRLDPALNKKGVTQAVFQLNRDLELRGPCADEFRGIWKAVGNSPLEERLGETNRNTTFAFELMRQMAFCNRTSRVSKNNLLMFVESADMLLPDEEINRMSLPDRKRVAIVQDWISDPDFNAAGDTVVFISESRSLIHKRIARLPQIISINIPLPGLDERRRLIEFMVSNKQLDITPAANEILHVSDPAKIAEQTSGLSLHAVRQLLLSGDLSVANISTKVEEFMVGQLGEGVVEFQRPAQKLPEVIGFRRNKRFATEELMPGFLDGTIAGAAVGGPIGGGKTFFCEAIAAELGVPVIILKGIRSKWFGETDMIFERLRRLLETFHKVVIFVDEADTQFGAVEGAHETEQRLTGKIQAMMSDQRLRGRVIWFLMTARIHRLSPDIRRPGRMDLIIPILDPEDEDCNDFINWTFASVPKTEGEEFHNNREILATTKGFSAATFAMLRSRIKSKKCATVEAALKIARDILQPDIEETRRYQTLQVLVNCTRKSLLVDDPDSVSDEAIARMRQEWKDELKALERVGVS